MNRELPAQLATRLAEPLPGWKAQSRFQPELSFGRHQGPTPSTARPAAVLLLLYPRGDQWHIPLILRPAHMPDHASQVSFPGGMIEPGETAEQAAVREYAEELGADAGDVRLLGRLSELYLYASNFRVEPWVGVIEQPPRWLPSPAEVARLMEVPVAHFLNPANVGTYRRMHRGLEFRAPSFDWDTEQVWGATGMILSELLDAVGQMSI